MLRASACALAYVQQEHVPLIGQLAEDFTLRLDDLGEVLDELILVVFRLAPDHQFVRLSPRLESNHLVQADLDGRIYEHVVVPRNQRVRIIRFEVKTAGNAPTLGRVDVNFHRILPAISVVQKHTRSRKESVGVVHVPCAIAQRVGVDAIVHAKNVRAAGLDAPGRFVDLVDVQCSPRAVKRFNLPNRRGVIKHDVSSRPPYWKRQVHCFLVNVAKLDGHVEHLCLGLIEANRISHDRRIGLPRVDPRSRDARARDQDSCARADQHNRARHSTLWV